MLAMGRCPLFLTTASVTSFLIVPYDEGGGVYDRVACV